MKVKNVTVEVKPLKDVLKDAAKVMTKLKNGKAVKPKNGLSFGSVEDFRSFFTPKRMELLRVIRHKNPGSIYELAKIADRDFKAVVTDIKILEKYGLIDTKKVNVKGGYKVKPIFNYDRLSVDIAM
jgi:predicted transcriptional regulator